MKTMPKIGPANNAHHWKNWRKRHHLTRPVDQLRAIRQKYKEDAEPLTCPDCQRDKAGRISKPCLKHFTAAGYPAEKYEVYFRKGKAQPEKTETEIEIDSLQTEAESEKDPESPFGDSDI
jgi:hypothetical protein